MQERSYFVYILGNVNRKVLYVGVTNNLERRLYEHRFAPQGCVKMYHLIDLLYFEQTSDTYGAITREKEIKGWGRLKKFALISVRNPEFKTLSIVEMGRRSLLASG